MAMQPVVHSSTTPLRTVLHVVHRMRAHQSLRLAVMVTHGCIRTFDVTHGDDAIHGLGPHFRLVGVYDGRVDPHELAGDIEAVMQILRKEQE